MVTSDLYPFPLNELFRTVDCRMSWTELWELYGFTILRRTQLLYEVHSGNIICTESYSLSKVGIMTLTISNTGLELIMNKEKEN